MAAARLSYNNQLMKRINKEHNDPKNRKRHYYFKADTNFLEIEHEGIVYKRFILGLNKCARARIEVIGQAPKGKSVRENAAMQILPLLEDYFANDVPFKGSLPEHIKRILPEIRRSQANLKAKTQQCEIAHNNNFSFSKCAKRDYERRKRKQAIKGSIKMEEKHMSYLAYVGIEDKSTNSNFVFKEPSASCQRSKSIKPIKPIEPIEPIEPIPRILCCVFCDYSDTNKDKMILHLMAHAVDNPIHHCMPPPNCKTPCLKERQYRHINNWPLCYVEGLFQFVHPDPVVVVNGLQCPLCKRLSESNNLTTYEFYTYSELVEHIWVHIGGHSLLCNLCASTHRYSIERVPNDTIQAMKHLKFKHGTAANELIQAVTSDWHPGNSLETHHIELIRKHFYDCGESCVEKLTRRVISATVKDGWRKYLGQPINCLEDDHQPPETSRHCDTQISQQTVNNEIEIIYDSSPNRISNSHVNKNLTPVIAIVGPYTFRQRDETALLGNEFLDDQMISAYYKTLEMRSTIKTFMFDPLHTQFLSDQRQSLKILQQYKNFKITEYEVLFFPFCKESHWYLIVVYVKNKSISYIDSMANSNSRLKMSYYVRDFVNNLHHLTSSVNVNNEWSINAISDTLIPKQNDGHNCGVFMLAYIEKIMKIKSDFNQLLSNQSIKQYRRSIWLAIKNSAKQ